MMSNVSIRFGTEGDAEFVAWAILSASRGHLTRVWFDIALERTEEECFAFIKSLCTVGATSWWHYSNFLMVEVYGRPVVTLCAFRSGDVYPASPAALTETMDAHRIPAAEQAKIWERGAYLYGCSPRPHDNCWVLEHVAALPGYRGRGYTSALLERALDAGRLRNLATAQITFVIGNIAAERAYQRAGFCLSGELLDDAFAARAGAPGLCRFTRPL